MKVSLPNVKENTEKNLEENNDLIESENNEDVPFSISIKKPHKKSNNNNLKNKNRNIETVKKDKEATSIEVEGEELNKDDNYKALEDSKNLAIKELKGDLSSLKKQYNENYQNSVDVIDKLKEELEIVKSEFIKKDSSKIIDDSKKRLTDLSNEITNKVYDFFEFVHKSTIDSKKSLISFNDMNNSLIKTISSIYDNFLVDKKEAEKFYEKKFETLLSENDKRLKKYEEAQEEFVKRQEMQMQHFQSEMEDLKIAVSHMNTNLVLFSENIDNFLTSQDKGNFEPPKLKTENNLNLNHRKMDYNENHLDSNLKEIKKEVTTTEDNEIEGFNIPNEHIDEEDDNSKK